MINVSRPYVRKLDNQGFTLIEVVVALAILTWVLGSAIFLVMQYADERSKMRQRFLGNQVAWNQLMAQYRVAQGWLPANQNSSIETTGAEQQAGQNWSWQLERKAASGENLYRYQVSTYIPGTDVTNLNLTNSVVNSEAAALSIFLLVPNSE